MLTEKEKNDGELKTNWARKKVKVKKYYYHYYNKEEITIEFAYFFPGTLNDDGMTKQQTL